mgnify:CR=1 FL=1
MNAHVYKDGTVGSVRRCFKDISENGIWWDEEILETNYNAYRKLSVYNMHGFPFSTKCLITEQHYTSINKKQCVVSFVLRFDEKEVSFLGQFKMYFSAYFIASIFEDNLRNIKDENEQFGS